MSTTAEPITPPPAGVWHELRPRLWSPTEFQRMLDLGIFPDRGTLLLVEGHVVEFTPGEEGGRRVEYTLPEFLRLWDANFFRDQRVQLLGAEILEEPPVNVPHWVALRKATRVMERVFAVGFDVRPQGPLDLTPHGRPHPDVAVVAGAFEDFLDKHPTTAVLVVEVSESTLEDDTHAKMSLYAAAGIADYWVIDTAGRVLVFRGPRAESGQPFGHAYGTVSAHTRDDVISPLAAPEARIPVADLLP